MDRLPYFEKPAKTLAGFLCLLSFYCFSAYADQLAPKASLDFSQTNEHGGPKETHTSKFDCLDKIFSVSKIQHIAQGRHSVEFRWVNPHGETQETTKYDFLVTKSNKDNLKLWAYLKLHRGQGAALFQWLDPATGLEEFIGEWNVEVIVDGEKLQQNSFEVNC